METISDSELIVRLQAGDLESLGLLYDRHRNLVHRTALAITGDAEAAADLLQDVFLRLHRFVDRVDVHRPLEPWLYRMTANLAYTWVKRRRWFQPLEDVAEWFSGGHKETPAHRAEAVEASQQVRQAIAALPLPQRIVVVLYYVNDLSLQEISDVLEVPIGTIKSRLYYGRQTLKDTLDEQRMVMLEMQYEFT